MIRDETGMHSPVLAQRMGAVEDTQLLSNRDRVQMRSHQKTRKTPKGFAEQLAETRAQQAQTQLQQQPQPVVVQPTAVVRYNYCGTGLMVTMEQINALEAAKAKTKALVENTLSKAFAHLL